MLPRVWHLYKIEEFQNFSLYRLDLRVYIYKVEEVPYPENDDAMTSYILSYWVSASWGIVQRGFVLLLSLTIFLL